MNLEKMRPVQTITGMWGEGINENNGGTFKYNIFDIFYNCHNVLPAQ
jgi:hypothetical protein